MVRVVLMPEIMNKPELEDGGVVMTKAWCFTLMLLGVGFVIPFAQAADGDCRSCHFRPDPSSKAKDYSAIYLKPSGHHPVGAATGGKVECASCHDYQHGDAAVTPKVRANPFYLRVTNERSELCQICHQK